jgi:hypothetical protein
LKQSKSATKQGNLLEVVNKNVKSYSPVKEPDSKYNKKERQDQIKKVLISSIRLKMKLKKQVQQLKESPVIDENVILKHLSFMMKTEN